jgi:hypothetical protein
VRAVGGPVDCVVSAEPVTYLLVVYGRLPFRPGAPTRRIFAKGRRPWLGLRFKNLFFGR